jgi:hypothetical protein
MSETQHPRRILRSIGAVFAVEPGTGIRTEMVSSRARRDRVAVCLGGRQAPRNAVAVTR